MDSSLIVNLATPIVVPLVIAFFKFVAPKIPSWVLPILAPILGALVGVISNAALHFNGNIWASAILGLAGVGVREIVDQLKEKNKDPRD